MMGMVRMVTMRMMRMVRVMRMVAVSYAAVVDVWSIIGKKNVLQTTSTAVMVAILIPRRWIRRELPGAVEAATGVAMLSLGDARPCL